MYLRRSPSSPSIVSMKINEEKKKENKIKQTVQIFKKTSPFEEEEENTQLTIHLNCVKAKMFPMKADVWRMAQKIPEFLDMVSLSLFNVRKLPCRRKAKISLELRKLRIGE